MYSSILFVVALLLTASFAQERWVMNQTRFRDGPMLRSHHHHDNPSNAQLTVHLIPHSHDDVGWLKTVDDYYYGGDQATQWAGVQYTIDTVVTELDMNPSYKFSFVEVAFLYRWWNNANQTQRSAMRKLIQNKQVEFINAGWCMNDEANAYYEDIIDQMTIGFRWIKDTFGVVPEVGWHIDPFGHQASQASLFSQMGFNSWFFVRIDYQDKSVRLSKKAMEMIWHPKQSSGNDNSIFTHVNYYHYSPPPGFCFDNNCRDEPIKDDPTLDGYNLPDKATTLVNYFKSMALHYRSNNLLHTIGEDFQYANAHMWYKNIDKLINYINSKPQFGITFKYSTPGEYIKAINAQSNVYPTKYDDFFPYADVQHGFWTGYFVSRVSFKSFIRETGRYTQSVRNHISQLKLAGSSEYIKNHAEEIEKALWQLQMANGILQHHDAVAGTAKQKVTNNYITTTCKALDGLKKIYDQVRTEQIKNQIGETVTQIFQTTWNTTQEQWGISAALLQNKTVLLQLFNPGAKGNYSIRAKVQEGEFNIVTAAGVISGDLICSNTRNSKDCEVIFSLAFEEASYNYAKLVPVKTGGSAKISKLKEITVLESTKNITINANTTLKFARATQKFDLIIGSNDYAFTLSYNYYQSYQGEGQKSGAYIFRPSVETIQNSKKYTTYKSYHYAEGDNVVIFVLEGDKTYTKFYFNKANQFVENYGFEVETFVDSIDVSDRVGKEVVMNLITTFSNNKTFYTDSNGLEEQKRVVDFRETWSFVNDEPVSGNYYPISSHISIIDTATKNKATVVVDRPQGGTSLKDGNIEIMIHRRTTMDDARGVGEPLAEVQQDGKGLAQTFRHYVLFNSNNHRAVQKLNDQKPIVTWSLSSSSTFAKRNLLKPAISVPNAVKLFLRPFSDNTYLLRVQNFDQTNTNAINLPPGWKLTEYTLGYNQLLEDWKQKKMSWKEEPYTGMGEHLILAPRKNVHHVDIRQVDDGDVLLKPFEIRTFQLSKA